MVFDCDVQQEKGDACSGGHFGSTGNCSLATFECECPPGFSGQDDWLNYNMCQVNLQMRERLHLACLTLTVAAFCCSVFGTYRLVNRWNLMGKMNAKRKKSMEHINRMQTATYSSASSLRDSIAKRRRHTILVICLFVVFNLSSIIVEVLHISGKTRSDNLLLLDVCIALSMSTYISAVWGLSFIWYDGLPAVRLYSSFIKTKSFLIRYPEFVKYATIFHIATIIPMSLLSMVLLPQIAPEYRIEYDSFMLCMLGTYVFSWFVIFGSICILLYKCLKSMIEMAKSRANVNEKEIKNYKNAMSTILSLSSLAVVFGSVVAVWCLLMAFEKSVRSAMYFYFTVLNGIGQVASVIIVYYIAYKTAGKNVKKEQAEDLRELEKENAERRRTLEKLKQKRIASKNAEQIAMMNPALEIEVQMPQAHDEITVRLPTQFDI